jgi:hypothetical protein
MEPVIIEIITITRPTSTASQALSLNLSSSQKTFLLLLSFLQQLQVRRYRMTYYWSSASPVGSVTCKLTSISILVHTWNKSYNVYIYIYDYSMIFQFFHSIIGIVSLHAIIYSFPIPRGLKHSLQTIVFIEF